MKRYADPEGTPRPNRGLRALDWKFYLTKDEQEAATSAQASGDIAEESRLMVIGSERGNAAEAASPPLADAAELDRLVCHAGVMVRPVFPPAARIVLVVCCPAQDGLMCLCTDASDAEARQALTTALRDFDDGRP